jgi:hypothetical protein
MVKYRIKQYIQGNKRWYEIEKKILFWWRTQGQDEFDMLGMGGWYPFEFKTLEDAKQHLYNHLIKPKIEVVYSGLPDCPKGCSYDECCPDCML